MQLSCKEINMTVWTAGYVLKIEYMYIHFMHKYFIFFTISMIYTCVSGVI